MRPTFPPHPRSTALTIDTLPVTLLETFDEARANVVECLEREIAARSGLRADEVKVVSRPRTQPQVEIGGSPSSDWHVSLSHAHGRSLGALSLGRAVGVDLEWIDPAFAWEPVAAEFFPRECVETWNRMQPHEARREFFRRWVRWEAALKCRGTGFGPACPTSAAAGLGLTLLELDLGDDYAGCLAISLLNPS